MTQQVTYLRTDTVPVAKLSLYPGNAKKGDVDAILASLRRNSQYRSLVVREVAKGRLVVLAGNHTMQALSAHGPGDCGQTIAVGDTQQPCGVCGNQDWKPTARAEIISCDDEAARRINLADNRTADLGGYDDKALLELLSTMDGDYAGSGYDDGDLDELLKVTGALAEETTAFLSAFTAPTAPAPTSAPAPAPVGSTAPAAPTAVPAPAAGPAPDEQPTATPPSATAGEDTSVPAVVFSAASTPAAPAGMPAPQTTVPIQWVVTIGQRDTIRAAIRHAQAAGGFDTAAEALTHLCQNYLTAQGASQ